MNYLIEPFSTNDARGEPQFAAKLDATAQPSADRLERPRPLIDRISTLLNLGNPPSKTEDCTNAYGNFK